MKEVYDELKEYRDKKGFPSFTETIRYLLAFRRNYEYAVDRAEPDNVNITTTEITYKVDDKDIEGDGK